ncbi:hypothetical protein BJ166DRAFT_356209 [Pestalotiopsis sp. NC0098]|nr:hypothetical protein BJ166DRAFT_356209 [Pestalotiopsis sp. NC0098]
MAPLHLCLGVFRATNSFCIICILVFHHVARVCSSQRSPSIERYCATNRPRTYPSLAIGNHMIISVLGLFKQELKSASTTPCRSQSSRCRCHQAARQRERASTRLCKWQSDPHRFPRTDQPVEELEHASTRPCR